MNVPTETTPADPPASPTASEAPAATRRRTPLRSACGRPHACPKPLRMRILAQLPILADLTTDQLERIDERLVSLAWSEGESLYTAGEPADHLYVIAAGAARAVHTTADGQQTVVRMLGPGALFGALDPAVAEHTESVDALVTVCALRLDTADFRRVLMEHPSVAVRVLDDVAGRLSAARQEAGERASHSVEQRVARALLRLADTFGQPGRSGAGTLIQLPLSRSDLAGMTGATPESVSRAMSRLRGRGIIDSGRRWTSILDPDALATVAGPAQTAAD